MTFLTLEASMSVTGPLSTGKAVVAAAIGPGAATAAGALNCSTSFEVIIPSIPDPAWISVRSIPLSAASFLAAGLAKGRPPLLGLEIAAAGVGAEAAAGGGGGGGGGGVAAAGAAAAGGGAAALEGEAVAPPSSTKSLNL